MVEDSFFTLVLFSHVSERPKDTFAQLTGCRDIPFYHHELCPYWQRGACESGQHPMGCGIGFHPPNLPGEQQRCEIGEWLRFAFLEASKIQQ